MPLTYFISGLKGKEIARTFYEKELQKTNQKQLRVKRVRKRKQDKLCGKVTMKYRNLLTDGLIKKDIV